MYENYGDKNFFELGRLVQIENDHEFDVIVCEEATELVDNDGNELFPFAFCHIDINDDWIDRNAVMNYGGMTEENFNPIHYAIDCISWYGVINFGDGYDYKLRSDIKNLLQNYDIDFENVELS